MTRRGVLPECRYSDEYCTSTLGYAAPNLRFVEGQIEDLASAGIRDESIDLVISNCVVSQNGHGQTSARHYKAPGTTI